VGVDRNEDACEYGRQIYGDDQHRFVCADAMCLNGEVFDGDITFDAIVCIETLEHLPRNDQAPFIKSLWEMLSVDGVFYFTCPLGDDGQSDNRWHLYEPTLAEIDNYLHMFRTITRGETVVRTTAGVEQRMGEFKCTGTLSPLRLPGVDLNDFQTRISV